MKKAMIVVMVCAMLIGQGCASMGQHERTGSTAGALTGAALGGIIGNNVGDGKNDVLGAAIGAAVGGYLGNMYGKREDYVDARLNANEAAANTITINVVNSNGSYTPVLLRRNGGTWIGPRGEVYTAIPSEVQLKSVYGF